MWKFVQLIAIGLPCVFRIIVIWLLFSLFLREKQETSARGSTDPNNLHNIAQALDI